MFAAMNDDKRLLKGTLTTVILKLLYDHKKMYGYEITKKVMDLTNGNFKIKEGALYPSLHKMEADGLIESTIEQHGNRPRKYYRLTQQGRKEAKFKLNVLTSFINNIQQLLNLKPLA